MDNLPIKEDDLAFAVPALQNQDPRLATEADNLKDIPQTQVFKISNKAHENPD
jgi:hypothetical protein